MSNLIKKEKDKDDIIHYIKTDDNKIINERAIKWIKKMDNCLEVCLKSVGCNAKIDTHRICEYNSPGSYNKLNVLFK